MTGVSWGMYIAKMIVAGEYVLIKKYTPRLFGAPGRKRKKKTRDTPKAMEKYNNKRKSEKLQMLMILNFDKGFHVVLDYPKDQRPQTYEEAEKNLQRSLYKISRKLKKKGIPFKYIAITERGKRAAALHHHIVIEDNREVMEELVTVWGNHIKFNHMYREGLYKDLAEYFTKIETKEENGKGKSKYHRSRNLKEPETRIAVMAGSIQDAPQVPKGYELVPQTLNNGFNELYGVRYQSYMIKREDPKPAKPPEPVRKKPKGVQKGERDRKRNIFDKIKGFFKRRKHE